MRIRLFAAAFVAFGLVSSGVASAPNPRGPNIVLIVTDDMGYADIGPFGSQKHRTPELDRMAREGMKLTSFYGAPVCSPSRAQILTGAYAQRVSIPFVVLPDDRHGLHPDERTVAEYLKDQGYATMAIGKWHLGYQAQHLPTHHGFNHYFGLPYDRRIKLPLMRDDRIVDVLEGDARDTPTERFTDEAVRFISEHRERPFFLYLAHTATHIPMHPGKRFRGQSPHGLYADWVEEVDWSVGRVLEALRHEKLAANTLVIFTSDNGPWLPYGAEAGTAEPLRGGKGSTWEGGVRVPTIAWWPGRVPANTLRSAVAGNIDFLPTFVSLAGGTVPSTPKIDGRDLSSLLLGEAETSPHEAYFLYNVHRLEAIRSDEWKLALEPQIENLGEKHFPADASSPAPRLYNLDTDIGERTNVAAQHPDIVARLQRHAERMSRDLGHGAPGPGVRPAAHAE